MSDVIHRFKATRARGHAENLGTQARGHEGTPTLKARGHAESLGTRARGHANMEGTRARRKLGHAGTRARVHANIDGTRARRKFGHAGTRARQNFGYEGTRRLKGTQGTQGTRFNRLGMVGSFLYFRANSRPTVLCFLNLRFYAMGRFQRTHYWSLQGGFARKLSFLLLLLWLLSSDLCDMHCCRLFWCL